jgi:hypothetical protein
VYETFSENSSKEKRERRVAMMDATLSRGRVFAWGALFIAVVAIIFLRAPETVLSPSLPFDEGREVFAHFYEHREAAQLLRFKSGYMPLIANLIGYAAVRMPTRVIPYAFVGPAVLIATITYCLFFARSFRGWFPSDLERALICIVFALAPVSDCLLVTTVDYSLWNLLAALILLTACRPPENRGWRYLHAFVCNLLVWSHPLAIIITPLVLWRLVKHKQNRKFYVAVLFNLIVHQIFGVAGIVTMRGLWRHAGGAGFTLRNFFDACVWTYQIVVATAFRTAFGAPIFAWAVRECPWLMLVWLAALAVALSWVARHVPRTKPVIAYTGYIIVTLTFLCCFLRSDHVLGDPMHFISFSPRYIYIQSLCFLLIFGVILTASWDLLRRHGRVKVSQPIAQAPGRTAFVPLAVLLCYYFILNTQFGYYLGRNTQRLGSYYDFDPGNGMVVREFFSSLAGMEQRRGSRTGIQLTAQKANDWSFSVDTMMPKPPLRLRFTARGRIIALILALVPLGYLTRHYLKPLRSN